MSSENLCGICLTNYDSSNPYVPMHKATNNKFHFVCYKCFQQLNNICPFCQCESNLIINPKLFNNIYDVCKKGDKQLALELLNGKRYDKIDFVDDYGNTALIWACSNSLSEVALELIKTGQAKPEQINNFGHSALILACSNILSDVALELIKTGQSKPEQINSCGNTALICACSNSLSDVALELIKTGQSKPEQISSSGNMALTYACINSLSEVALELIKTGQSKPGHITNGESPLTIACKNCLSEVALELIKTGQSKPDHQDFDDLSALDWANCHNLTDVVFELCKIMQ